MSDQDRLTPGEHDRMRAQLLAGAARIRPAGAHRGQLIAAGVALLVVGAVAGGVVVAALLGPADVAGPTPSDTPDAAWPTACPVPLDEWMRNTDTLAGDVPLDAPPEPLAAYLPAKPPPSCIVSAADGESMQTVAYAAPTAEQADRLFADVRAALDDDETLSVAAAGPDVASYYVGEVSAEVMTRVTVSMQKASFADLIGLDSGTRVVLVSYVSIRL